MPRNMMAFNGEKCGVEVLEYWSDGLGECIVNNPLHRESTTSFDLVQLRRIDRQNPLLLNLAHAG